MTDNKKIRIRLYGKHLGYIRYDLYDTFLRSCEVIDYSSWIKRIVYENLNIQITSKESIDELKDIVVKSYYEDITDWLSQKMRESIKSKGVKNMINKMANDVYNSLKEGHSNDIGLIYQDGVYEIAEHGDELEGDFNTNRCIIINFDYSNKELPSLEEIQEVLRSKFNESIRC